MCPEFLMGLGIIAAELGTCVQPFWGCGQSIGVNRLRKLRAQTGLARAVWIAYAKMGGNGGRRINRAEKGSLNKTHTRETT